MTSSYISIIAELAMVLQTFVHNYKGGDLDEIISVLDLKAALTSVYGLEDLRYVYDKCRFLEDTEWQLKGLVHERILYKLISRTKKMKEICMIILDIKTDQKDEYRVGGNI